MLLSRSLLTSKKIMSPASIKKEAVTPAAIPPAAPGERFFEVLKLEVAFRAVVMEFDVPIDIVVNINENFEFGLEKVEVRVESTPKRVELMISLAAAVVTTVVVTVVSYKYINSFI